MLGYARVSTKDQSISRQIYELKKNGVAQEDIYFDEGVSGCMAYDKRPGSIALLERAIREKRTIVVCEIDRLFRSTLQMSLFFRDIVCKYGIGLKILNTPVDTTTEYGFFIAKILMCVAEFELSLIRGRIKSGQRKALAAGKSIGRPRKLEMFTASRFEEKVELYRNAGLREAEIAKQLDVCVRTYWSYKKKFGILN